MKKQIINATLTSREMQAVAEMLLGTSGINVDPIIKDLYPMIDEGSMSIFRCKLALMLNGKVSEFKSFEGFRKDSSRRVYKFKCVAESSLMGTRSFEIMEIWEKDKVTDQWVLGKDEYKAIGSTRCEPFSWELYESIEEAEKH